MTTRIDKVAVLGTGVLGSQIAYLTAYSGFDVAAYDISDEILDKARNGFRRPRGAIGAGGRGCVRRPRPGGTGEDRVIGRTYRRI